MAPSMGWECRLSLRARLGLLVLGSLLPLAVTGLAASTFLYRTYSDANSVRLLTIARTLLNATEAKMAAVIGAGEVLALSASLEAQDFDTFRLEAQSYLVRHLPQSTIVLTDRAGAQRVNTGLPANQTLPTKIATAEIRSAHNEVIKDAKSRLSGVFVGQVLNEPRVAVLVPVFRGTSVEYVLGISIAPEFLADVILRAGLPQEWTVAIFDRSAATVARYPFRGIGERASPTLLPALREKRDQLLETRTHEGDVVATAVAYSAQTDWSVAMGIPQASIAAPFRLAVLGIFVIGAGSLLIALIAAIRLARNVLLADRHRDLLVNELNHRVKNTLTMVQAFALQTLAHASSKDAGASALEARILALSRAHNLLTDRNWDGAPVRAVTESAIGPYAGTKDAILLAGSEVCVSSEVALSLALVLNELATNATKHGALAGDGQVSITWTVSNGKVHLVWLEMGGPPVVLSNKRGFGTRFIERSSGHLRTELSLQVDGVRCSIEFDCQ
jgi:two-component sensor histidine kinase